MDIPGVADAMSDPNLREKAEEESERLLEELKKTVKVETKEIGVLRKEMRVTVPQKVIGDFLAHNIDEMRRDALVPGFRKGRAPRTLIVKRFGPEVRDSLKTLVLGQSYFAAIENEKLQVLGDPLVQVETDGQVKLMSPDEALPHLKLPESGDFQYTCELELSPQFELPELKGITIEKPDVKITEEDVETAILHQRKNRGRFEPMPEGTAAEVEDMVVADVTLTCGEEKVKSEENVQLGVRPQRLDGIALEKLGETLKGIKAGETRKIGCTISDDYERKDLRGKSGEFTIVAHEIKRLTPVSMELYLEQGGYASEEELRQFVRDDLESELGEIIQKGMKNQVLKYLLDKSPLDLPEKLSARQTDRAITRKVIELQQKGVPFSDIEARIDELRTVARDESVTALKLQFILDKVAEKLEVEVTDEEVNGVIAAIARKYNRRFDRIRDELQQQGTLPMIAEQIKHDKCVDLLLADAKVVDAPEEKKPKRKKSAAAKEKSEG